MHRLRVLPVLLVTERRVVKTRRFRTPSYIACGSLYGERGGEILRDAAVTALHELAERRLARLITPGR